MCKLLFKGIQVQQTPELQRLAAASLWSTPVRLCACHSGIVCTIISEMQLLTLLVSHVVQLQLFDEVALVRDGRLLHVLSISGSEGVYPSVLALAPRFTAGEKNGDGPLLALTGAHLAGADAAVLARCQGAPAGHTVRPVNSKEELLAYQTPDELKGQESRTACWRLFADGNDGMLCVWLWQVVML